MVTTEQTSPGRRSAEAGRESTEEATAPGELLAEAERIAQLGSWEWDLRTQVMSWSDEHFRIAGSTPGRARPSWAAFLGAIHPKDRTMVERKIAEGLRRPSCLEFEYRLVRPDGAIRSIHCRAEVLADDTGAPTRLIGTVQDVTEARRFARGLASEVEQLQQLSQAAVAIYAAEGVEEILEVAAGHAMRIVGGRRSLGSLAGPGGIGEVVQLCREGSLEPAAAGLLAAVEPLHHPLRVERGEVDRNAAYQALDETEREIVRRGWLAVPLVDVLGGATGAIQLFEKPAGDYDDADEAILAQIAQITSLALQKARLFDELHVSEERYRRLFNAHLSGDFVATPEGELLEANPALARILGFESADDVKEVGASRLYREETGWARMVEEIRRQGRPLQQETELVRSDGKAVWAIINIVGVFDRGGRLGALQGCLFDITDRRRAEAALRESQQQLIQSQKMEAVGQLAGGIAHDFNNMLMAIQGFARLLDEELPPEGPARAHLAEIRKAADRSARLTRQLLAYGRKQVLQPEIIELNGVVTGLEEMLKRLIGAHITFVCILEPEAGRVHADPGQLQQVLMNIALNARDAMPEGGRLTVRTARYETADPHDLGDFVLPPGDYVTLSVTDTGSGIPGDLMPRIFEPYFTTKPVGVGSGLGLSTAYGIVKQSSGFLRAESVADQGSTFTVYLPRTQIAAPTDGGRTSSGRSSSGGGTVLVAEDESVLRTLAAIVLRRSGFHVLEAEDGVEAMEMAQEHDWEIDVLVTDLIMPRMGGKLLAERLLARCPTLKTVFMSGYAEEAIERNGQLVQGSIFLAKPFAPAVLAGAVRELLGEAAVAAPGS